MMLNPAWFWLAGLTGAIMLSSAFTGFCPIHYVLCKLIPVRGERRLAVRRGPDGSEEIGK